MATESPFVLLPRELRDEIYQYHFLSDGGYSLNYRTGKMLKSTGSYIDLDLRLVCRLAANETRGLPFKLNALHFSTVCTADVPETLGRFGCALRALVRGKYSLMLDAASSGCLGSKFCSRITNEYSEFGFAIWGMMDNEGIEDVVSGESWKEVPSISRRAIMSTMKEIAAQPPHADSLANSQHLETVGLRLADALSLWYEPWTIPTEDDLEILTAAFSPESTFVERLSPIYFDHWRQKNEKEELNLSAASIPIEFLRTLPASTRTELRNFVLHEDRFATLWSECHAQRLITHCQENFRLHIERRVDVWKQTLAGGDYPSFSSSGA